MKPTAQTHHTFLKGDIAVTRTLAELYKQGWCCALPVSQHTAVDLIAYRADLSGKVSVRTVQVKYNTAARCVRYEGVDDIAIYLSDIDKVCFMPVEYANKSTVNIRHTLPNAANEFWWVDDLIEFASQKPLRKSTTKDFGIAVVAKKGKNRTPKQKAADKRSSKWKKPSKEELQKQVWRKSMVALGKQYGVTDVAVRKVCKAMDIVLPPKGFFARSKANQAKARKEHERKFRSNQFA